MRVRRETGDFNIVVNSTNEYKTKINKLLYAADMLGQIVDEDGTLVVVVSAKDNNDKTEATVYVGENTYKYTRATGAFEKLSA